MGREDSGEKDKQLRCVGIDAGAVAAPQVEQQAENKQNLTG